MKVYLLTHGEYSEKEVRAVFTDLEEAKRVAELTDGDVSESYELDGFNAEEPPAGMKFWRVTLMSDGEVWCSEGSLLSEDGMRWYTSWDTCKPPYDPTSRSQLGAGLYAESKEHAIKIVNEWRGQIVAGVRPESSYGNPS